ncbi:MAG: helix-turn-helix domain-containing protein [Alicyclobacillus sp.]|nr:helix-turn-helix domain-containing protein [Alicyclobacillus sp.]
MKHFRTGEWIEVPEEEIEHISLEHLGNPHAIPVTQGDFVQVSNYVLMFWSHLLGPDALSIYLHLLMHCYGNKEVAWPSRQLLAAECGISPASLNRNFERLEKYYLAWKICVERPNGQNESNIYIVRRNVPYLTQEQYEQLPRVLQKRHDEYIRKLEQSGLFHVPEYETASGASVKKHLRYQHLHRLYGTYPDS